MAKMESSSAVSLEQMAAKEWAYRWWKKNGLENLVKISNARTGQQFVSGRESEKDLLYGYWDEKKSGDAQRLFFFVGGETLADGTVVSRVYCRRRFNIDWAKYRRGYGRHAFAMVSVRLDPLTGELAAFDLVIEAEHGVTLKERTMVGFYSFSSPEFDSEGAAEFLTIFLGSPDFLLRGEGLGVLVYGSLDSGEKGYKMKSDESLKQLKSILAAR